MNTIIAFALIGAVAYSTSSPTMNPTLAPTSCVNNGQNFVFQQLGTSPKVRLAPDCAQNEWVTFEVTSVEEIGSGSPSINKQRWTALTGGSWTKTSTNSYKDVNNNTYAASEFVFTYADNKPSSQLNGRELVFTIYVFSQKVDVVTSNTCGPNENETCTLTIDQNSVKYSIDFPKGWPFLNTNNNLTVTLRAHEKAGGTAGSNTGTPTNGQTRTKFGGYMIMDSPEGCLTGAVVQSGTQTYPNEVAKCASLSNTQVNGNNVLVTLKFANFGNNAMSYDPALTVLFAGSGVGQLGVGYLSMLVAATVFVFAA